MRFKFTQREIEKAVENLVIIIDTREQDCNKYKYSWDREKVKYYSQDEFKMFNKDKKIPKKDLHECKLPAGDYSAMLPKNTLHGIDRALWFDKVTVIEKKKSIDELAGNIKVTNGEYLRLLNEFARLKANGTRHRILIEDGLYFKHIYEGGSMYNKWNINSLRGAIDRCISMWHTELIPIPKEYMSDRIYSILKNDVRTYLLENFCIENLNKLIEE